MHNYRDMKVWKDSVSNSIFTYEMCKKFPKHEMFGLTSQMQRAAVSIASNIAEGCGRGTDPQLMHFINIALGSACELETQIIIAEKLYYISEGDAKVWLENTLSLQKQLRSFRDYLAKLNNSKH